eukprot:8536610-Prorocentrum_lima.AAC.1
MDVKIGSDGTEVLRANTNPVLSVCIGVAEACETGNDMGGIGFAEAAPGHGWQWVKPTRKENQYAPRMPLDDK